MLNTEIKVKILDEQFYEEFPFPTYATSGSAGIDLRYNGPDFILKPQQTRVLTTGFSMHIANPNIAATIIPRSGLGTRHGIVLGNLTGLIDSDYQGEVLVPIWNRMPEVPKELRRICPSVSGRSDYVIKRGDRIAQMMIVPIIKATFDVVDEFVESDRGDGALGSTGKG